MKIQLSTKVTLDITDENDKVIKSFNVTYREANRKELKKAGKDNERIFEVYNDAQKLSKKESLLDSKVKALSKLGNSKNILEATNKLEDIYKKQDKLDVEFEKLGGMDKLLDATNTRFDISVGGKDKDALKEFALENDKVNEVLEALAKDAKESKGKHS